MEVTTYHFIGIICHIFTAQKIRESSKNKRLFSDDDSDDVV